jgi:ubiquinol-cytochrome c reductase iron-sulfur subunit
MTLAYFYLFIVVASIFLFCYFLATWVWIKVVKRNNETEIKLNNNISNGSQKSRRDFLYLSSISIGGVGVATFMWPFIKSMNPAEDTLALGTTEVDLSNIAEGQSITVKWRGKPVFIRKRTQEEIYEATNVDTASLRDPVEDSERVQKPEWLILEGVCTHLGCVPLGQKATDTKGEYNGWFCPCHGSHYDTSGRVRKGPAPDNLPVPPYKFISDTKILIG